MPTLSARFLLAFAVLVACSTLPLQAQEDEGGEEMNGRRDTNGETTTLAFNNVTVERLVPFIVESTGKVVIPRQQVLNRRVTILSDEPVSQMRAVDLVFLSLQQEGIAVIESGSVIFLLEIADIAEQDLPVIGPDESVLGRTDLGTIAQKVYSLTYAEAPSIAEVFEDDDALPEYALLSVDESSNTVVLRGSVALLQQMEQLISAIDRPRPSVLDIKTFSLKYAEATQVANNIRELYESNTQSAVRSARRTSGGWAAASIANQLAAQTGGQAFTSQNIRVTSNAQQNTVTVLAEKPILANIQNLIDEVWDLPVDEEDVVPRIYDLQHTDPVKVREILIGLFGQPGARGGRNAGIGRLAGQFSFEPVAESGRLVVVSQTPDALEVIDEIIQGLDQPQSVGLPEIIELKHADAEELAEQLNALLATEGTLAQIPRQEKGLSETGASSVSPFASQSNNNQNNQNNNQDDGNELITFWWQRARPPVDNRGASNLVGALRIVPVWRQNAVMVLSPPEYRQGVIDLIKQLDARGRQVLISAVIAEISLEDADALGLRVSNQAIDTNFGDNIIGGDINITGTENNILGDLFETSVLTANTDIFAVLQLLAQQTAINILSEPQIFTSDNQEAEFFDGQDIPFIVESQFTDNGNLNQSTEYRAVGIQLRVRPRITVNRDVDLRVNLELSSIQPGTTINNQFVVDRRETTTQLVVQDGQTVVISGILRTEDSDVTRKVPLLGDLPLIGFLFRSIEREVSRTELIAFVTPRVVDSDEDVLELNRPFNERLNEMRDELGADIDMIRREIEEREAAE